MSLFSNLCLEMFKTEGHLTNNVLRVSNPVFIGPS